MAVTQVSNTQPFPPLMPVYDRAGDLMFERGEGVWLFDTHGQRYLDAVGGVAVTGFGHAHPALVKTLCEQGAKVWTVSNIFNTPVAVRLAQRLVDLTFADTVFFQNSGVEAWDASVKVARKYFSAIGKPERYRVITFQGCFHGRSLSAIAASKAPKMVNGFGPMMDGFDQVPWNDLEAVKSAITPETAAIFIEPLQGEAGVREATPAFLQALRRLCDEHGLLLCFDEIQCGLGRTGTLFAHEALGVTPDIMCIAKTLGNGYPIGACLATAKAAQGMTVGTHGSTFGGNPLAAALGNTVLDLLTAPGFLDDVRRRGALFSAELDAVVARHPEVFTGRRGKGMIQGLVCKMPNTDIITALREEHLLTIAAANNVIRLLPALIVTDEEIHEIALRIDRAAVRRESAA